MSCLEISENKRKIEKSKLQKSKVIRKEDHRIAFMRKLGAD
jgi:hypothetical protein